MAAFHFTAKIHSRAKGASAIRAAAYRAGERLEDKRAGRFEDYTRKSGVLETAILAPAGAPGWVQDRQQLWERVEAREKRKDAQLAQELEINLPRELSDEENWRLITDFCREHLVAEGRVCDIAFHKGRASDAGEHPHAHILMPLRSLAEGNETGFGEKHPHCDWRTFLKRRDPLQAMREQWASFARSRALEFGIDLGSEWDSRSYADRGIELEGQPKHGATAQRMERQGMAADRTEEVLAAQRRNGAALLADPQIALDALTARHSTFSRVDLARYVFTHSAPEQYEAALAKAQALAISVGFDDRDGRRTERFSSAAQIALETRMVETAATMAARNGHAVRASTRKLMRSGLSPEQRDAAAILLEGGDLSCLVGYAGAGKSTMLAEVRAELAAAGYNVRGAALSGIAAQNLTEGSGIDARTLASLRYRWAEGKDPLTARDVLVIDEAGMIGSKELAGVLEAARTAGAKVILVGDPQQLQAIESGAAFRAIAERTGYAELTEIRRQQIDWQRDATRELATARTADAIQRYAQAGMVESAFDDSDARALLVSRWQEGRSATPTASRIMLAHSREDVQQLNEHARAALRAEGRLGADMEIETNRGSRSFATGDRLLFLRNERNMGVRNGTLGTITGMEDGSLTVLTDDGRRVAVDPAAYMDLDHGYAVTIHKSQGVTVNEAYVLASRGFDRHLTYVSCSRHRHKLSVVYSRELFGSEAHLLGVLGRERAKDTTLDYRETAWPEPPLSDSPKARTFASLVAPFRPGRAQRLRDSDPLDLSR